MKINMRISFAGLVVAAIVIFAGWAWLGVVTELAERAERSMAMYEDSRLTYTTQAGQTVTIPAWTECKYYSRRADECVTYYAMAMRSSSRSTQRSRHVHGEARLRADRLRPRCSGAASHWE